MSLSLRRFVAILPFVPLSVLAQTTSLSVLKTATPSVAVAGSDITWTLQVSTEGPDPAANVVLADQLPAGTGFKSITPAAGWSCPTVPAVGSAGAVQCTTASFAPGSAVITIVATTDPSLANGSTLDNTATVSTTTSDPDQNDNTSILSTLVESRSDLGVVKGAAPDPAPIGGNATYTLNYSASGPSNAASVAIADTLPAGINFSSISAPGWTCSTPAVGANGAVNCTRASVPAGSSGTITISVTVDASVASGTLITNSATISGDVVDGNAANATSNASFTARHITDLGIAKTAGPDPAPIGSTLTYTLTVSSSGPSAAPNTTVTDALPAGTTFTSIAAAGWSCTTPAVGANGTVTCSQVSMAPGSSTITIVVTIAPAVVDGTSISNTATVSGAVVDGNATNGSATAGVTARHVSDLAVAKSASPSPTVIAGSPISYTIGYSASGPSAAPNVTVTDVLPAGTTFTSITAAGWSCSTPAVGANGTVTCSQASLAAGQSGAITLAVTASPTLAAGTTISNTAQISGSVTDGNTANNSATSNVSTTASSDVGVTKSAPATIFAGNAMTYAISWTATGPSTAANVTITDALPAQTTFTSITAAGFTCATPAAGTTGSVICNAAALSPGASGTITIGVTISPAVTPATVIVNTVNVSTSTPDPNAANNSSSTSTTVNPPLVTGVKSVSTAAQVLEGTNVTYTIPLVNGGSFVQGDNAGDEFVDVLPSSLTLVSATASSGTASADVGTNTVRWNGSIPAGGTVTITIVATIRTGTGGSTIANQGTIRFDGDNNGTGESTTPTSSPAGAGPTTFNVLAAAIPALSPLSLLVFAALIALAGWRVTAR